MTSLQNKTISSVLWSFLQKIGSRGIEFIVTIVLARLLTPADFGLIGMLAIFIALSQKLVQAGFSEALIQKKDADEEDFSSVFYINFGVSLILYIVLYFCAPLIADFYHQPKLIDLTRVLSLVFVVNSFGYVQETRLKKSLDFKKLMYIHLPSTIFSGIVAIVLAYTGFGVWAIVAQRIVMRGVFVTQLWIYSKWKPLKKFNQKKAKRLFSFGGRLMLSGVIHTITDNLYQITIGRFFPVQTLGYYENADKLTKTPTNTISDVLNSVTFPAFSAVQNNDEKLKRGYKKVMQQVLFWLTPILIIAAVLAKPFFLIVFGQKWLPAVPFFQILCIARIFSPLTKYNLNIVSVKGRSDIYLKLEIIRKLLLIVGVFAMLPIGIIALVYFKLIYSIIAYFINSYYSGKFIGYSTWAQLKDILPIFALGVITGILVYGLDYVLQNESNFIRLSIGGVVGITCYGFASYLTKLEPLFDFKEIAFSKATKFFRK